MFVRMFVDVFVVRMIFETTTLCDLDATLAMSRGPAAQHETAEEPHDDGFLATGAVAATRHDDAQAFALMLTNRADTPYASPSTDIHARVRSQQSGRALGLRC